MSTAKFPWGKVISIETYDLKNGDVVEVVEHHPWKYDGATVVMPRVADTSMTHYHCEAMHASFNNVPELLIHWFAHKNLGLNQHALAQGICRALDIKP